MQSLMACALVTLKLLYRLWITLQSIKLGLAFLLWQTMWGNTVCMNFKFSSNFLQLVGWRLFWYGICMGSSMAAAINCSFWCWNRRGCNSFIIWEWGLGGSIWLPYKVLKHFILTSFTCHVLLRRWDPCCGWTRYEFLASVIVDCQLSLTP